MKYEKEVSQNFIKVWEEFYINYSALFKIVNPIYKKYKELRKKRMEKEIQSLNFSQNVDSEPLLDPQSVDKLEIKESNDVRKKFREQFLIELQKVDFFYNENLNKVIKPKLKEVKEQIKHGIKINEFRMHNETFEMAIKEIYKDIHLIHRFIETNLEIKDKLIQKYKKYFGIYSPVQNNNLSTENNEIIMEDEQENDEDNNNDELEAVISDFISFKSSIGSAEETLKSLKDEITQTFVQNFSFKYRSKAEKVLKQCIQDRTFTEIQSFYLGVFVGLLIFQMAIICIIAWYYDIDMDNDIEFKSVFPMFRGFFIICLV